MSRIVLLLAISFLAVINVSAQFFTQSGNFLYALNSSHQVFALAPDNKIAVSFENDRGLTTFDPITGTEFDHKSFGFGPLEVGIAQTSAGLRVAVLTSQGGPRQIWVFALSQTGQLTQIGSTQLTTSNSDFGSNLVLSTNADVGFVLVADGLVTFSLLDGAVLNKFNSPAAGSLALSEANGKRVLAIHGGASMTLVNLINPIQPVVLGSVSFPANGETSGSSGAPPVLLEMETTCLPRVK